MWARLRSRGEITNAGVPMLNTEAWPDDTDVYAFAGRAFEDIGNTMFADTWSGDERCSFAPSVLPDQQALASETQLDNAFTYLGWARPDLLMANLKGGPFCREVLSKEKRPLFPGKVCFFPRRA